LRLRYAILAERLATTADMLAIVIVTMLPKVPSQCAARHLGAFFPKGADRAELWTKFEVLRLAVPSRVYDLSGLTIEERSAECLKWVIRVDFTEPAMGPVYLRSPTDARIPSLGR